MKAGDSLDQHHEHHHSEHSAIDTDRTPMSLWLYAVGSTLVVSVAPFLLLFLIPLDNSPARQPLLKVLLSFAAGGLLGDAFLHLIPHAMLATGGASPGVVSAHGHSHGGSADSGHTHDMSVGLCVLSGIVTFLVVEKLVRIVKGSGHGHSHAVPAAETESLQQRPLAPTNSGAPDSEGSGDGREDSTGGEVKATRVNDRTAQDDSADRVSDVQVAGYLNLAADFAHNFTDGLAIGASYLAGHTIGVVTTATIILHEVPHEIGDYAILVQSGVPASRAIRLQLLTAVGALTGTVISLLADGADLAASSYVLPFTAGGFIYIATVSVLPELLQNSSAWQSLRELAALVVGIYMMVLIAQYE